MTVPGAEPGGATPLDPDERAGMRFKHLETRGELDELEQVNIEQGLVWLSARKRGDILDETLLRELHRRLFGEVWTWAGTFRTSEKNIGVDPAQIAVQLRHLAADTFLMQYFGSPPIDWLAGQDIQAASARRDQYIAALRSADAHDFAPLLAFVGL